MLYFQFMQKTKIRFFWPVTLESPLNKCRVPLQTPRRWFCYRIVSHCSKDNCFLLLTQIGNITSIKFLLISYHNPSLLFSPEHLLRYLKREKVFIYRVWRRDKEIAFAPTMTRADLIAGYLMGERNRELPLQKYRTVNSAVIVLD